MKFPISNVAYVDMLRTKGKNQNGEKKKIFLNYLVFTWGFHISAADPSVD